MISEKRHGTRVIVWRCRVYKVKKKPPTKSKNKTHRPLLIVFSCLRTWDISGRAVGSSSQQFCMRFSIWGFASLSISFGWSGRTGSRLMSNFFNNFCEKIDSEKQTYLDGSSKNDWLNIWWLIELPYWFKVNLCPTIIGILTTRYTKYNSVTKYGHQLCEVRLVQDLRCYWTSKNSKTGILKCYEFFEFPDVWFNLRWKR